MNITIDNRPYSTTEYYNGEYRDDDKAYKFTIASSDNLTEVTWCDEKPSEKASGSISLNDELIEQQILFNFLSKD